MRPFVEKIMDKLYERIDRAEERFGAQMSNGEIGEMAPIGKVEAQNLLEINHNTERPFKFVLVGKDMNGEPKMFIGPRNYKSPEEAMKWAEWTPQERRNAFDPEQTALGCFDWKNQTYVYKESGFDEAVKDFEAAQLVDALEEPEEDRESLDDLIAAKTVESDSVMREQRERAEAAQKKGGDRDPKGASAVDRHVPSDLER